MKSSFPPESPKHCPCGHIHISWSQGEDEVYCWDCNKKYALSACFGSRTPSLPDAEKDTKK